MNVIRFSIHRDYDIMCKLFAPEGAVVRHVMIGVHGFAGDKESSMLEKLALACADDVALLCFDFPAHGASPVTEDKLTVENCKADLLAVAQYVRERYPRAEKSIFATSFGGYISLLCCDRLPEFQFVLRAPAVTMPELLITTVLKTTAQAFREAGTILCGFERPIRLPYTFYEELQGEENLLNKQFTRPMLIVHGNRDDIVPLSVIEGFAAGHGSVCLHIIDGADHRFKNPGELDRVVEVTRQFLKI